MCVKKCLCPVPEELKKKSTCPVGVYKKKSMCQVYQYNGPVIW
jgi:hypothetical protein